LIPFFIKYPLCGYKRVQLYKILLILGLKDFGELTEISNIWNNNSLSQKNITIENIQDLYSKLSPIKSIYNAKEIIVENTLNNNGESTIKIYSSIKECCKDLQVSPKTIIKYLNNGITYRGYIFKTN